MDINMANRQCCDLDIRDYKTKAPFLFADFCNTTTAGFSGDSVYAMKKGSKAIAFHNPIEGKMGVEFQVHPFKVYALLSDGVIETTAIIPVKKNIECSEAGKITIPAGETVVVGSVFVYAEDDFGGTPIVGTFATNVFSATTITDIAIKTTYTVAYLTSNTTGVKKVSFNNKKTPKDYRITQKTLDKDDNGNLVPVLITAYKATIKRNLEMSFSSSGDSASIKLDFDVLEDKDGNVLDIVEIVEPVAP
ncbi:MAG: hypothetical protein RR263_03555 [Oscillospiraceae bacterium]